MPEEFISDIEAEKIEKSNQIKTPDFIPDNEAEKFFGIQETQPETKDAFLAGHPILKGISDFVGTTGLGKGIAQGIFLKFTPEGRDLLDLVSQGKLKQEDVEKVIGKTATTKEILGSALQIGVTAAIPALPKTATIAGKAAQFGGVSAIAGVGRAIEKEKPFEEIAKDSFIAGLTGAAAGAVFGVAGKAITKLTQEAPEKLFNTALKVNKKIIQAGKSPSKELIKEGIFGDLGKIHRVANEKIGIFNNQITKQLEKSKATISSKQILDLVETDIKNKFGLAIGKNEITSTLKELPINSLLKNKQLNIVQANTLRQQLDRLLGESAFITQKQLPLSRFAIKSAANSLRKVVQETVPETQSLFKNLSNYIKTQQLTSSAISLADKNFKIGLRDIVATGTGGLIGGPVGAAVGFLTENVLSSPVGQTTVGVLLDRLGKIPTDTAGKIGKEAIINLISELIAGKENLNKEISTSEFITPEGQKISFPDEESLNNFKREIE